MRKHLTYRVLLLAAVVWLCGASSFAASTETDASSGADRPRQAPEIQSISVSVDGETSPAALKKELRTVETPGALSIFFYENIWERLGSPRSLYDPAVFERDIARLKEYFIERGYFHASIETTLTLLPPDKMDIGIRAKEGVRSLFDTVKIAGIEEVTPEIAEDIRANCGIRKGMPYSTEALEQERLRALKVLHNGGYPDAEVDAIVPVRYLSTNNISVTLHYKPGRRYLFGPVTIAADTSEVDRTVVLRQLDFVPGEIYNEEKKTSSEQNLNRLGLLDNATLKPLPRTNGAPAPAIPMQISYRVIELKELTPEVEVNNEDDQFTTGIGLGYSHRNLFGNASTFSTRARVRLKEPLSLDVGGAFKYGLKEPTLLVKADVASLVFFPYFFSNRTSANITLGMEGEKLREYTLNSLRGRFGITHKLAAFTTGFAEWSLERVDPAIFDKTSKRVMNSLDTVKQFNSILTLTLQRDKTDNLFSPTTGFFHQGSIEESGVIPRLLKQLNSRQIEPSLPFSEYVKASFLFRDYEPTNNVNSSVIAMKLKGGAAFLYNKAVNPTPLPLTHRFFAGGSGSVRGWNYRSLTTLDSSGIGGNVLLEASVEDRVQLFRNWGKFYFIDLEAMWGVLFIDAGNLWDTPKKITMHDMAVAAGVGLRYETFIGPIRFDVGLRVYDPKEAPGQEWIFAKRLFHNSYSVFHFGLGHAF